MAITDFADYAQPLLDRLEDAPDKTPLEERPPVTTFPGGEEISGELRPLYPNEEDSLGPKDGDQSVLDEDRKAARDAYPMAGLDVLAFYKSFRFKQSPPFRGTWG